MSTAYHPGPDPITPEQRIILMDDDAWESFITNCCEQLRHENKYSQIKRLGGAGDKGRDVACYTVFPPEPNTWDLFQAKAYKDPLNPTNMLADFAKFLFYVFNGDYPIPSNYYISGTQDVGTTLHDLLGNPDKFRTRILTDWKTKAGNFGSFKQPLTPALETFISTFDFKIIKEMKVSELLSIHARSPNHWAVFGVLPPVVPAVPVPTVPESDEQVYVSEILRAYGDFEKSLIPSVDDIPAKHSKHFTSCREQFYHAESLNRFSRDFVPAAFDALKEEVRTGISPVVDDVTHPDGLKRLNETLKHVTTLTATTNPLRDRIHSLDLQGTCHHLANDGKVKWVPDE